MTETRVKIDGMACGMCESHVNEAIRSGCRVKKVTSSHKKGEAVILSEEPLEEPAIRQCLAPTGYRVLDISSRPYEKKGFFR